MSEQLPPIIDHPQTIGGACTHAAPAPTAAADERSFRHLKCFAANIRDVDKHGRDYAEATFTAWVKNDQTPSGRIVRVGR